jgi:hypothetical protein
VDAVIYPTALALSEKCWLAADSADTRNAAVPMSRSPVTAIRAGRIDGMGAPDALAPGTRESQLTRRRPADRAPGGRAGDEFGTETETKSVGGAGAYHALEFWRFGKLPIRIGRIIGDQLPALLHHFGRKVCMGKKAATFVGAGAPTPGDIRCVRHALRRAAWLARGSRSTPAFRDADRRSVIGVCRRSLGGCGPSDRGRPASRLPVPGHRSVRALAVVGRVAGIPEADAPVSNRRRPADPGSDGRRGILSLVPRTTSGRKSSRRSQRGGNASRGCSRPGCFSTLRHQEHAGNSALGRRRTARRRVGLQLHESRTDLAGSARQAAENHCGDLRQCHCPEAIGTRIARKRGASEPGDRGGRLGRVDVGRRSRRDLGHRELAPDVRVRAGGTSPV